MPVNDNHSEKLAIFTNYT